GRRSPLVLVSRLRRLRQAVGDPPPGNLRCDADVPLRARRLARMRAAVERADGVEADVRQRLHVAVEVATAAFAKVTAAAWRGVVPGEPVRALFDHECLRLDEREAGEGGAVDAPADRAVAVAQLLRGSVDTIADRSAVAATAEE